MDGGGGRGAEREVKGSCGFGETRETGGTKKIRGWHN